MRHNRRISALALAMVGAGLLILGIAVLVMLPWLGVEAQSGEMVSSVPSAVNYPAPEVKLSDLNGSAVSLADYRGKVVLVNHWATWCPPCKAEMPALQAFYQDYRDRGLVIVGIDEGEPESTVASFVEEYGLTFPVWQDPEQISLAIFGYSGLPSSYVVDRDGTTRLVWFGAISQEMLEKHVAPLLEE